MQGETNTDKVLSVLQAQYSVEQFIDVNRTGIDPLAPFRGDEIANSKSQNGKWFDLSGRQMVNGKWPNGKLPQGIYIKDGKKTLIIK